MDGLHLNESRGGRIRFADEQPQLSEKQKLRHLENEADEIGGFYVPAKSEVLLMPFITHRHAEFWNQPDRFEPERFSAENSASRPKFAYFPFGGGARQCIGNHFAQMEAQIIIAMVLQKFRVSLAANQTVEPETSVTLRPKKGVKVILEKVCEARNW